MVADALGAQRPDGCDEDTFIEGTQGPARTDRHRAAYPSLAEELAHHHRRRSSDRRLHQRHPPASAFDLIDGVASGDEVDHAHLA